MKRITLALSAALLGVMLFAGTAQAGVTQWSNISCTSIWETLGRPVPFVCLAEDINFGGDKITLTGSSDVPNFAAISHTPAGGCNTNIGEGSTWNDCISSVWGKVGTGDSFCIYPDSDYWGYDSGNAWEYHGTQSSWTFSNNDLPGIDWASSAMLQQSGPHCGDGGV